VERCSKRSLFVVIHDEDPAVMQRRGGTAAIEVALVAGALRVHRLRPGERSVHLVGEESDIPKIDIHALTVSDRGLRRVRVLHVDRPRWDSLVNHTLPADAAGRDITVVEDPKENVSIAPA